MNLGSIPNRVAQLALVMTLAASAGACSTIPEWMGGDPSPTTADNLPPPDQTADNTTATDQTANDSQFPDLADVPSKPKQPSTPDERKQVQAGLVADRTSAQYSADTLKGGQDVAAAPPPPPGAEPPPDTTADSTPPDTDKTDTTADKTPPVAAPTTKVAATQQPTTGNPAVPPDAVNKYPQLATNLSDSQLGFKRSNAPALDGQVASFVAQPIIDRYRQTAASGSVLGVTKSAVPMNTVVDSGPVVALNAPPGTRKVKLGTNTQDVGGTEKMTGAVVADFDALDAAAVPPTQASYTTASGTPTAVVFFPHDTTILNATTRAQVRATAQTFLSGGGQGYIRVVGHSSSRTANMPLQRHLVYNFERSQARANSVAQELIKAGVPASKVLVEAVGDTQPVYYESMPEGEEGNRRAEIFLQS